MPAKIIHILNKIFPILDTLYFLQLTNYDTKIFLTKAHYFYFRRNLQVRDHLIFTNKIKLIIVIYLLGLFSVTVFLGLITLIAIIFTPYFIAFINFIIQKLTLIQEDNKLKKLDLKSKTNLQTILITGSQGKTTLKYLLYNATKAFRRTQIIPDNINTTSGVVNWLSKNLRDNTELLIFETEPFYAGEMSKIINNMNPHFRILTNLTDQHLMRFGTLKKLHGAYLEITQNSQNSLMLSAQALSKSNHYPTSNIHFIPPTPELLNFTNYQSYPQYIASYMAIAERILLELGVESKFQKWSPDWLKDLPSRRKNIVEMWGYEVIDDSYNISLDSAKSSVEFALGYASKENKKLIVITAGIPESSTNPIDANIEFGQYLKHLIDEKSLSLILLQSEFYPHIKNQISKYQSASNLYEIPAILNLYNALEYTVLFLPELNDFYY